MKQDIKKIFIHNICKYIKKLLWISMLCIKECKFMLYRYLDILTLREIK